MSGTRRRRNSKEERSTTAATTTSSSSPGEEKENLKPELEEGTKTMTCLANYRVTPQAEQYSDFMAASKSLSQNLSATSGRVEQLTQLAKRRFLFEDRDVQLPELTGVLQEDMELLREQVGKLHALACAIPPLPPEEVESSSLSACENRVDVGLQTEFDDPDVYYFAGGRNIACQTDPCEQYGALEPFPTGATPVIIVLDPGDSDTEAMLDMSVSLEGSVAPVPPTASEVIATSPPPPPAVVVVVDSSTSPLVTSSTESSSCDTTIDTAVNTVAVETKTCATQLSVGVLTEEGTTDNNAPASQQPHDGSGDKISAAPEAVVPVKPSKTTFADKARNGILRRQSTALQAKSVPSNMNRIGTTPSSAMSASVKGSSSASQQTASSRGGGSGAVGKGPPSYRSNIASRCRTAVNTNKQQVVSPVKSKLCTTLSSSSCAPTPTTLVPHSPGGGGGGAKSPAPLKSPNTLKRTTTLSASHSKKAEQPPLLPIDKKKPLPNNVTRSGTTTPRTPQDPRTAAMVRSKSMINPPSSATSRSSANKTARNNSYNNNNNSNPNSAKKLPAKPDSAATVAKGGKGKNFVSLPDVSVHRKRNSTVDEDGWETVRARSNRSKWSPSSSSLSIPIVAEGALSTAIPPSSPTSKEEGTSTTTAAEDDEEIKRKDQDLDDAIREEELLEAELRQVEKDFEMIENESRDDTTTSENDNAPSPDPGEEDSQFFFICMDNPENKSGSEFPPREQGRIVALREKLMSPAKRCDGAETLRRHQAKLAKAERNREKLLQAKYRQYVELSERFQAINETTKKLVSEREELIAKADARLQRATENRKQHLQNIVRKAHDEEEKAKEIAFINLLEAQNKRHDYLASAHEIEGRLQTIQEERRQKLEERASKALSVIERQGRIRHNWQSKLERMQEKRRKAEERITREKEEKAKERVEAAQEKARDREERISALNAAKQQEKLELQKKIQQKQQDTARRHEENMEQIRQKAIELSVPRPTLEDSTPSIVRVCTLCKVSLPSEVQELTHLRGKAHIDAVRKAPGGVGGLVEGYGLKFVCDLPLDKLDWKVKVDKNRCAALKKHCKKLMQKLVEGGLEYEKLGEPINAPVIKGADPDAKAKIQKSIRELDRMVTLFEGDKGSPAMATQMDRLMTDIRRTSVRQRPIKDCVFSLGVIPVALRVIRCTAQDLPDKLRCSACNLLIGVNYDSQANMLHCLRGTAVCSIIEALADRLSALMPVGSRWVTSPAVQATGQIPYDPLIESLLELLFGILNIVPDPFHGIGKEGLLDKRTLHDIKARVLDIIGYLVASSVIDRFAIYLGAVRAPIEDQPQLSDLLKMILDFLVMDIYALHFCCAPSPHPHPHNHNGSPGSKHKMEQPDSTQLVAALESSELAGAVSMSYTLLLHQGAPTRPRLPPTDSSAPPPPPPGERTSSIVRSSLVLINALARMDHQVLQNVLGSEAVSLQFRHIASQLLWQVVPHRQDPNMRRLLNELLIALAYFTVANRHNQQTIQSGQTPTVLQQLCTLPPEFFRDIKYIRILFPTLISATFGCPENARILTQNNIDLTALNAFLHSVHAQQNDILRKLEITPTSLITPEAGVPPPLVNGNTSSSSDENGNVAEETEVDGGMMNGHAQVIIS